MEFEIVPYVGVGPISFGMTRAEIRKVLAAPVESFKKTPTSAVAADAFGTLGFHVHYDSNDRCKAVEFGRVENNPTFRGRKFSGQSFAETKRWLQELDPDIRIDSSGLRSLKFGFGLYAPSASQDPQAPVEGVIVFRLGYYKDAG
jgi:hypothetical protein